MSFISYAQNFEDVMLWRALREVEEGFYIDAGAGDPCIYSVSKAFYDRGWRGINIEPLPRPWADLKRERVGDINLQCAVGDSHGETDLWEPEIQGWASVVPEIIAMHQEKGFQGILHRTPVLTLAEICHAHVKGEVHFLKIDVEGHERAVIAGMDFSFCRPWIVVVEATLPDSTVENHQDWEPLLLAKDYSPVYADGLNRFYLAGERAHLKERFRYPPNVFDGFVLNELLMVEAKARQAKEQARQAEEQAWQAQANARHWQREAEQLYASTSWRITRPLRDLKRMTRIFRLRLGWLAMGLNRVLSLSRFLESGPQSRPGNLSPHARRICRILRKSAENG
jgi:FkbM family methyltransferase